MLEPDCAGVGRPGIPWTSAAGGVRRLRPDLVLVTVFGRGNEPWCRSSSVRCAQCTASTAVTKFGMLISGFAIRHEPLNRLNSANKSSITTQKANCAITKGLQPGGRQQHNARCGVKIDPIGTCFKCYMCGERHLPRFGACCSSCERTDEGGTRPFRALPATPRGTNSTPAARQNRANPQSCATASRPRAG